MLTPKQSFQVGFLLKCAEAGLNTDETLQQVKLAIDAYRTQLEKQGIIPELLSTLGTTAIAAPIIAGGASGYGLAKLTHPDRDVVEEAKKDEIISEYQRLAEAAKRRTRARQLQSATGRRVIALSPNEQA